MRDTPQHTNVAEESILNDTNCDWVVLNDGSVAVLPGVLEKPVCEVSEYYGDNVFMLVSRVNKALQRSRTTGKKRKTWNREYKEQQDYEAVWELARKYVTII